MTHDDGMFCGIDVPVLLAEAGVPGCSVAVLDGGRIVRQRAFGVRSTTSGEPVTGRTMFQACSISKPVSMLVALQLVRRGVLDLDADVDGRLNGWRIPLNVDWRAVVTLRQLASHTAGLSAPGYPGYPLGAELPSTAHVLAGTEPANGPGVRVDGTPGLRYRYSGGGTTVVQLLMETATGTPAAQLLDELALSPLGMADSTFAVPLPAQHAPYAAHGHRAGGRPVPGGWRNHPELCAAGLWSTPADLLRFAQGVQAAWQGKPGALLPVEDIGRMLTPHSELPDGVGASGGFQWMGLGPYLRTAGGGTAWFGHPGSNDGFRCQLMASTATGQGAAVMTNSTSGAAVISRLLPAIARAFGWSDVEFGEPYDPPGPALLGEHAGTYTAASGLRVELADTPDGPTAAIGGQPALHLLANGPGEFEADELDLVLRLVDRDVLTLEEGGVRIDCARPAR
ncbi:serine hydrolase domain-containing protein [Kitasatospora sp. NPDC048365]|uniref:serine hydrolase domain-containing protein n=1 Tax=Kitasatospora sp. NPDC048365 TaxID=3364050 RepID=UPI0037131E7A